jgi:hypothetical protein
VDGRLDAILLRETKLQKPHSKRYGDRGAAYEAIVVNLNSCGRLSWTLDKKHVQGRLQHLAKARRVRQIKSSSATGVEEDYGEVDVFIDEFVGETDDFKASEANKKEMERSRESSLAEGGRQVRELSMRRQAAQTESEIVAGSEDTLVMLPIEQTDLKVQLQFQ